MVVAFDGVVVPAEGPKYGDSLSISTGGNWRPIGVVLFAKIAIAIFV
jgi:hypothetical protein